MLTSYISMNFKNWNSFINFICYKFEKKKIIFLICIFILISISIL